MSAAIITASTAAAIAANQHATEVCKGVIPDYDAVNPTIEQLQVYAACVQRLYPGDLGVNPWIIKATVLFLLLMFVAGIVKPAYGSAVEDRVISAVMYPILAACAIFIGVLGILGVQFLIS